MFFDACTLFDNLFRSNYLIYQFRILFVLRYLLFCFISNLNNVICFSKIKIQELPSFVILVVWVSKIGYMQKDSENMHKCKIVREIHKTKEIKQRIIMEIRS